MKRSGAACLVILFFMCITCMPVFAESNEYLLSLWQDDSQGDGSIERVKTYVYTYDANDFLIREVITDNFIPEEDTTTYTYDADGNKISEQYKYDKDIDGTVETVITYTYTYDANRNLITKKKEKSTYTRTYTYTYDTSGRKISEKENYDRDNDGVIDSVTTTSFSYDANGNKITQQELYDGDNNGTTDSVSTDTYTYDAGGNLTLDRYEYDDGNDGIFDSGYDMTYTYTNDASGKKVEEENVFFDGAETTTALTLNTTTYNTDGKLIFEKRESDFDFDFIFDSVWSTTISYDANGNREIITYDDDDDGTVNNISYLTWQWANTNDVDNDGDTYKENQGDCDDTDASIYPGAVEVCGDGIDQDCNGLDLLCTLDTLDVDDDGDGYTENQGDCNDSDATINPGADEICGDGIDQDCDGGELACPILPDDIDNDGDGYSENQGDCDDTDSTIAPDAIEICGDGIDQDCSGNDLACVSGPSPPTGVDASDNTYLNKVQVTWTPASGITTYDIFRADMPAWTGTAPKRIASSVTGTSYDDTTAAKDRRYYYWVKSRDNASVSKYSHFDPGYWGDAGTAPARPTGVDATDNTATAGTVRVTWNAVADSLVYEIFRADIPAYLGGKIKKLGTATSTSYDDTTAATGTRYYYWVKARNSWGVSRYSLFDTGYTGLSALPPDAPDNVTATDNTVEGKVSISWDTVDRAVVYEIWRATKLVGAGGQPVRIGFVTGTSFDDTTGTQDVVYYYWVKARDSWGSSKYSVPDTGHHSAGKG